MSYVYIDMMLMRYVHDFHIIEKLQPGVIYISLSSGQDSPLRACLEQNVRD